MSVLIRDMKMPMNCNECPLGEYEDSEWFVCYPMNLAYRHMAQCDRLDDCPLVIGMKNYLKDMGLILLSWEFYAVQVNY